MWPNALFSYYFIKMNQKSNLTNRQTNEEPINTRGIWYTTYGRLVMTQRGDKVTGYYSWKDGIINGTITGDVLTGRWDERLIYTESRNYGNMRLVFDENEFTGKWSYEDSPDDDYIWEGRKVSSNFEDKNCYRYRVVNDSPNLPEIFIGNEMIGFEENSSYFYPKTCLPILDLNIIISDQLISRQVSVNPGYSYSFLVKGALPYVIIDTVIDNPF
ncbi:hypothetical protein [Vallitalea okinawensis]|uniref:hypothetical protein n=1 Tax=Vallitalea okinawensis TaxID=2078660 RepID=UPI000CFB8F3A|nr:hypothetical protein [Vallitalea okinawensis]